MLAVITYRKSQDRFLAEFTAFLQRTFSQKIEKLKEANIICRAEEIQGSLAKIMTSLYLSDEEVKIKFYMHQQASEWKIYDILLDQGRFGLVSSYRAQLQWLLHTSSFEELLHVIREKNAW
jgi:ABC-type transporter MlaC component